jgi:protein TonB
MTTVRADLYDARLLGAVAVSVGAHLCFLLLFSPHDMPAPGSLSMPLTARLMPRAAMSGLSIDPVVAARRESLSASGESASQRSEANKANDANGANSGLNLNTNRHPDRSAGRSFGPQKRQHTRPDPGRNSGDENTARSSDSSPASAALPSAWSSEPSPASIASSSARYSIPSSAASPASIGGGLQSEAPIDVPTPVDVSAAPIDAATSLKKSPAAETPSVPSDTAQPADSGAVARYRIGLMGAMAAHKIYPEAAQQQQWQGRCELDVEFGREGVLRELRIGKSSGYGLLDDSARAMLREAQSRLPVPAALRGQSFSMRVVIVFDLHDQ